MGDLVQFPKQDHGVEPPDVVQIKFTHDRGHLDPRQWVAVIDVKTGEAILRRPIKEVGEWLNENGFSYATGSMAIWYRDYFKLKKRETLNAESRNQ
jgi:hypothetical protein